VVLRSFGDRFEIFVISVSLSPSFGHIQPLLGNEASYPAVRSKLSLIRDLLSRRSGHPQGCSLSTGIKAFVVMVGLTIIDIFTFDLSIICYCFVHLLKSTKSHRKIL
jgi:hypothetical protein